MPVSTVGRNFRSPVDATCGEVSCATGMSAIFSPAISLIITPPSPSTGEPSALVMLIAAQGYFDAFIFSWKFSGPKSNSWLPGTAMSNGSRLVRSMVFWPLSNPDSSDGDSMSPSKT